MSKKKEQTIISKSLGSFAKVVGIGTVRPFENNPRINDGGVDAVAASLKEFGWNQAIVVDGDGVIICGHTRLKAAQKLGLDVVPVVVASHLTSEQVKAYRVADNRSSELSAWDVEKLEAEMFELSQMGFDMEPFGFDEAALAEILGEDDPVGNGKTDPDAAPEAPPVPISERGAVYQLGPHRLMCGDATNPEDVARLCDRDADLWLTDPPYNVDYTGKTKDALKIQNDKMSNPQFRAFLVAAFESATARMKPGASFYMFHADSEGFNFRGACHDVELQVRQCLIWVKNVFVMGRQDYQWKHEPILYGWKSGGSHAWYGDRSQTTVLEFNRPARSAEHPTMKPVNLLVYLIKNSSKRGDTVLDTFAGSGSTVIACEQTGRAARAMEIDPRFVDVIRQRWAEFVHGEGCEWATLTPEVGA